MSSEINLFLDSGAFSAWNQGIEIDVYDYIEFIKEHSDIINLYANLDVIGVGGKQPNEETARLTLENQRAMEGAGLDPLPCFHYGEPFEYLEYYVDEYDYIALGGVAKKRKNTMAPWLGTCFGDFICDEEGYPKVKAHGFAVTSLKTLVCYPWYSVDSTAWIMASRAGELCVPRYQGGQWIYDEHSWRVGVSSRSPKDSSKHIDTFSPKERQITLDYIHEKGYQLGSSEFIKVPQTHELKENERWAEKRPEDKSEPRLLEVIEEEGVANRYQMRDEMNIIYFQDLECSLPDWPWPFRRSRMQGFAL